METKTGTCGGKGEAQNVDEQGTCGAMVNGRVGVRARSRHLGRSRVGSRAGHMWVYEGKGEARRDV